MANLVRHHFGWVGNGFNPGVEHNWRVGPVSFDEVLNVTAIPVKGAPRSSELMVKDVRVLNNPARVGWTLLFTIRNTGLNPVSGYGFNLSVVSI
jgi:hypothetical protein